MERLPGYDNWKLDNQDDEDERRRKPTPWYEHEDFDPDAYNDMMEDR